MTDFSTAMEPGRANNPPGMPPPGFDIWRLDCAVEALRSQRLNPNDRAELVRIVNNLTDLMENPNGHAH